MGNVCQFCGGNPGYLRWFSYCWSCNLCLYEYDLFDHDRLNNKVEIDGITGLTKDFCFWDLFKDPQYKPQVSEVLVEELECDLNDLSTNTNYVEYYKPIVQSTSKRWSVEILD